MTEEILNKIRRIASHYSKANQLDKTFEELSELRTELIMADRYGEDFVILTDNTISECADVIIMCIQLAMQHGRESELVEQIEYKVNRQIGRMESEK